MCPVFLSLDTRTHVSLNPHQISRSTAFYRGVGRVPEKFCQSVLIWYYIGMLRLSKLTDYGTLVLNCLSSSGESVMSARELAGQTNVGLPTVSKVLKLLVAANLVSSTRGSSGGYRLAAVPSNISVLQIIVALEGAPTLTECTSNDTVCFRDGTCALQTGWQSLNIMITTLLSSLTLADLAKKIDMNEFLTRILESRSR